MNIKKLSCIKAFSVDSAGLENPADRLSKTGELTCFFLLHTLVSDTVLIQEHYASDLRHQKIRIKDKPDFAL